MASKKKKEKPWWSSLNRFTRRMGNDYSSTYTKNHRVEFYVLKETQIKTLQMVLFKPFLDELTYDFSLQLQDYMKNPGSVNHPKVIKGTDGKIKVSLILPAVSLNEAIINAKKVDFFLRLLSTDDLVTLLKNSGVAEANKEAIKEDAETAEQAKNEEINQQNQQNQGQNSQNTQTPEQQEEEEEVDPRDKNGQGEGLQEENEAKAQQAISNNESTSEGSGTSNPTTKADKGGATAEGDANKEEEHNKTNYRTAPEEPATTKVEQVDENALPYTNDEIYATYQPGENAFYVFFSNMIQSGNYTKKVTIFDEKSSEETYKNMKKYGFYCSIMDISAVIDTDMGFFESSTGYLWPKVYKLSFTCDLLNLVGGTMETTKNVIGFGRHQDDPEAYPLAATDPSDTAAAIEEKLGGKKKAPDLTNANYHVDDIKHWPFGIKYLEGSHAVALTKVGNDYSSGFSAKTGYICFSKYEHEVKFKPYIKDFKISRKIDSSNIVESKTLLNKSVLVFNTKFPQFDIGFDVVANSVSEAIINQEKLQRLLRMFWAKDSVTTKKAEIFIKFANLINKTTLLGVGTTALSDSGLRVIPKTLSFKPDLEMGFFEYNGMIYMKAFSMSFSLESNDSSLLVRI